jgi:hypothetical protein
LESRFQHVGIFEGISLEKDGVADSLGMRQLLLRLLGIITIWEKGVNMEDHVE